MPVQCDELALELAAAADSATLAVPETAEHVRQCLRCQVELVRYRTLRRRLRDLAAERVLPDTDLLEAVLQQMKPPAAVHDLPIQRRRLRVVLGGVVVAGAGIVGAVIASRLSTRPLVLR